MFGFGYNMMGYNGWGGIIGGLVFILILGAIIYLSVKFGMRNREGTIQEQPIEILKKRYARGEITKDEFDQMKNDLKS